MKLKAVGVDLRWALIFAVTLCRRRLRCSDRNLCPHLCPRPRLHHKAMSPASTFSLAATLPHTGGEGGVCEGGGEPGGGGRTAATILAVGCGSAWRLA